MNYVDEELNSVNFHEANVAAFTATHETLEIVLQGCPTCSPEIGVAALTFEDPRNLQEFYAYWETIGRESDYYGGTEFSSLKVAKEPSGRLAVAIKWHANKQTVSFNCAKVTLTTMDEYKGYRKLEKKHDKQA